MGMLLRLDAPVPRLVGSLAARGVMIDEPQAVEALTALVETYRAGHLAGVDQHAITELRRRSGEAMAATLPVPLDAERAYQVVMGLLRFQVLPGSRAGLEALRAAGIRIGFASDWDHSLGGVLLSCGIADLADVAVASAEVGAAKPDPATLRTTVARLGLEPEQVLVVGQAESDGLAAAALGAPFRLTPLGSGVQTLVQELLAP